MQPIENFMPTSSLIVGFEDQLAFQKSARENAVVCYDLQDIMTFLQKTHIQGSMQGIRKIFLCPDGEGQQDQQKNGTSAH